jgi:hypothetical protein
LIKLGGLGKIERFQYNNKEGKSEPFSLEFNEFTNCNGKTIKLNDQGSVQAFNECLMKPTPIENKIKENEEKIKKNMVKFDEKIKALEKSGRKEEAERLKNVKKDYSDAKKTYNEQKENKAKNSDAKEPCHTCFSQPQTDMLNELNNLK